MNIVEISIVFFWFLVQIKKLFFWSFLWQLKEYNPGRMKAHFQTKKGQSLLLSFRRQAKVLLFLGFCFFAFYRSVFLLLFGFVLGLEAVISSRRFSRGKFLKPVFTKRIIVSFGLCVFLILFWLLGAFFLLPESEFLGSLFAFDILAPLFFSMFLLSPQPFVFYWQKKLLRKAKAKMRRFDDLKIVGITGSYGKSSTKDFLAEILSQKYKVLKTKKSQNSTAGITNCILNELQASHEVFVCEIGAYKLGEVREMAEMIGPGIGILTGINAQHLATFGSLENIIEGKFELLDVLPSGGTAVLNGDNKLIKSKLQEADFDLKTLICSLKKEADFCAGNINVEKEKLSFELVSRGGEKTRVELSLVGGQNVINFLMAAAAANELGMSIGEIARAGRKIKAPESGMRIKRGLKGAAIIDDSYSANPSGVNAAINHLKLWEGERIIVMPCLVELGEEGLEVHEKIGERIGGACTRAIITKPDCFAALKKGAVSKGMPEDNILLLSDPEKILKKLKPHLEKESVVLLESRVPQEVQKGLLGNPSGK